MGHSTKSKPTQKPAPAPMPKAKPETKPAGALSAVPKPAPPPEPNHEARSVMLQGRCRQAIPGTPLTVKAVSKMLERLPSCQLPLVVALITALNREEDASTPAETFVRNVVMAYGGHEEEHFGLAPEYVQNILDTFRKEFKELMRVRTYLRQHYQGEPEAYQSQPWPPELHAA